MATSLAREQPLPEDFCSPAPPPRPPFERNIVDDLPKGTGIGPEADVWPVYNEQADKWDKEMIETFNGGMDNLLIFAALFSAVVTAFLVISIPMLQPDPAQITIDALTVISSQLAQQNANGPLPSVPTAPFVPESPGPTTCVVAINALWTISLFISLSTSVLAMLVKQWVRIYATNLPSPPKERALARQARYDGLKSWNVEGIANALPVFIHLAVGLFLAGFTGFAWGTSSALSLILLACLLAGLLGYVALAIAPIIWSHCPYKSPITSALNPTVDWSVRTIPAAGTWIAAKCGVLGRIWDRDIYSSIELGAVTVKTPVGQIEATAVGWLAECSSDRQIITTSLFAGFSIESMFFRDPIYVQVKQALRAAVGGSAHFRALLRPFEPSMMTNMKWEDVKPSLERAFLAGAALDWEYMSSDEGYPLAWAQAFPELRTPKEDRFWYHALVWPGYPPHLSGFEYTPAMNSLYLLGSTNSLPAGTLPVSLFALLILLGPWRDRIDLTCANRFKDDTIMDFVSTSIRLPTVLLCAFRSVVDPLCCTVVYDRTALSAMKDFFVPLIQWKGDSSSTLAKLRTSAIQLAVNELKSGPPMCFDPAEGLRALLQWFKSEGFMYREGCEIPKYDRQEVEREHHLEVRLLQQCLRTGNLFSEGLSPNSAFQLVQVVDLYSWMWEEKAPRFRISSFSEREQDAKDEWKNGFLRLCSNEKATEFHDGYAICTYFLAKVLSDAFAEPCDSYVLVDAWLTCTVSLKQLSFYNNSARHGHLLLFILIHIIGNPRWDLFNLLSKSGLLERVASGLQYGNVRTDEHFEPVFMAYQERRAHLSAIDARKHVNGQSEERRSVEREANKHWSAQLSSSSGLASPDPLKPPVATYYDLHNLEEPISSCCFSPLLLSSSSVPKVASDWLYVTLEGVIQFARTTEGEHAGKDGPLQGGFESISTDSGPFTIPQEGELLPELGKHSA